MNPKRATWEDLAGEDRAKARLAGIARTDTLYGGARALTLIRHLEEGRLTFDEQWARSLDRFTAQSIVSEVYASDQPSRNYSAFECGECGSFHLGYEAAAQCCCEALEH